MMLKNTNVDCHASVPTYNASEYWIPQFHSEINLFTKIKICARIQSLPKHYFSWYIQLARKQSQLFDFTPKSRNTMAVTSHCLLATYCRFRPLLTEIQLLKGPFRCRSQNARVSESNLVSRCTYYQNWNYRTITSLRKETLSCRIRFRSVKIIISEF